MRCDVALVVFCVGFGVVAAACDGGVSPVVDEGEGESGEGEFVGEGEGESGEGEGEFVGVVDVPDRACVVVSGVAHPGNLVVVEAALPLLRTPGELALVALDEGRLAFIPARVGDIVFGEGDAACFVHVAAFDGLTLELTWANTNVDVDLEVSVAEADGRFCISGFDEFAGALGVDVDRECSSSPHHCTFANCNPNGSYTVDFDDDGAATDRDPVILGDARGPATEFIVVGDVDQPLLAMAHVFNNGPADVVLRAYLDDVLVREVRDRLEANNAGAAALLTFGGGDEEVCAISFAADRGRVEACGAEDPADVDVAACAARACFCADASCVEVCSDPDDIVDGALLSPGTTGNLLCAGDVDLFAIDAAVGDEVTVSLVGGAALVLEDDLGVLATGQNARAVVRAPPVVVTASNASLFSTTALALSVVRLADRCAVDDPHEPDDVANDVNAAAREVTTRSDGILCGGSDVDCALFTPVDDRLIYLDRLVGDADCVVDGGFCADVDARHFVAAGDSLTLCVRDTSGVDGVPWHLRSERPACDDDGNDDAAAAVVANDGDSGVICGRDVDFYVVHVGAGGASVAVDGSVSVVVVGAEGAFFDDEAFIAAGEERDVVVSVSALPRLGSDGTGAYALHIVDL